MSKRARITLDLEPEAANEDTSAAAEETAESNHESTAEVGGRPKAKPKPYLDTEPEPASIFSGIDIGAVLKVAVVGLAVISAVLLLKRKP